MLLLARFTITSYLVFSLPSTYIVSNIRLLLLTSLILFVITSDSYGYLRVFGLYVLFSFVSAMYLPSFARKFFELSNLHTHLNMRSLRPAGSTKRAIPYGYGFSLVSCPNYFFELMGWVTVAFITSSIAGKLIRSLWLIMHSCTIFSLDLHRCLCCANGYMGIEETQNVQKGIWQAVSPSKKGCNSFSAMICTLDF